MSRETASPESKTRAKADRAPTPQQYAKALGADHEWALARLTDEERQELAGALQAAHQVDKLAPFALKVPHFRARLDKIIERTKAEVDRGTIDGTPAS